MNKPYMDINYYQAVVDTGKLITVWIQTKEKETSVENILVIIENHLEEKHGPFSSQLSNRVETVNESLELKKPNSYWKGVQDTLNLIKNFVYWKRNKNSTRSLSNFLEEMIHKSQLKLIPEEDSLLLSELGIAFNEEFKSEFSVANYSDNIDHKTPTTISTESQVKTISSSNDSSISIPVENKEFEDQKLPIIGSENEEIIVTNLDSEESDISTHNTELENEHTNADHVTDENNLEMTFSKEINSEKDLENQNYLRSALDELNTVSQEKDKEIDDIEIRIKDSMFWSPPKSDQSEESIASETELIKNQYSDPDLIIKKDKNEEDESKLLSSSLREALKMLREED